MAKVVLGLGTSHSPQLSAPADIWLDKGEEDRDDPRGGDYDALAREKASWIGPEITPERLWSTAMRRSSGPSAPWPKRSTGTAPDVAVVIGDDQCEVFTADHMPALNINIPQ